MRTPYQAGFIQGAHHLFTHHDDTNPADARRDLMLATIAHASNAGEPPCER